VIIYTFVVHNHSMASSTLSFAQRSGLADSLSPVVRSARRTDVEQIHQLVSQYVADGSMLPRTAAQIALNFENYIVAVKGHRVVACAALEEYSPSLAEVCRLQLHPLSTGMGLALRSCSASSVSLVPEASGKSLR
jgi:hypothetical protein